MARNNDNRDNWDGTDRRRHVDPEFAAFRERMEARMGVAEHKLVEGDTIIRKLSADVEANTKVTSENTKITKALDEKLQPISEAWDVVKTGVKFFAFVGRVVLFFLRNWQYFIGAILFVWAITHGETIDNAIKAFWKAASHQQGDTE